MVRFNKDAISSNSLLFPAFALKDIAIAFFMAVAISVGLVFLIGKIDEDVQQQARARTYHFAEWLCAHAGQFKTLDEAELAYRKYLVEKEYNDFLERSFSPANGAK